MAVEINDSKNITFANYHGYRVTRSRQPFATAVRITNSSDIRFRNVHIKAENGYAVCDANGCGRFLRAGKYPSKTRYRMSRSIYEVREREFAVLDVDDKPPGTEAAGATAVPRAGRVASETGERLLRDSRRHGGRGRDAVFRRSSPAADLLVVDGSRTDRRSRRAARCGEPRAAKSGDILVVSSAGPQGTVYVFDPKKPADRADGPHSAARRTTARRRRGGAGQHLGQRRAGRSARSADLRIHHARSALRPRRRHASVATIRVTRRQPVPSGGARLSAGARRLVCRDGRDRLALVAQSGCEWADSRPPRASRIAIVSGAENRTYRATVQADGTLRDLQLVAERGGESVAVDTAGNTYVANGQVFVYDGGTAGRPDRRARAAGAVALRRRRSPYPLHSHAPRALRRVYPGRG